MAKSLRVAVCGATGAVGNMMVRCLEERNFPARSLKLLASPFSEGKKMSFHGESLTVETLKPTSFGDVDLALFSAGASVSLEYAPLAAAAGCVVVDNSSAWRMDPAIPLVVPEVNPHDVAQFKARGIIANPNCSTIQMVVALKPLHDAATIRRVVVSTYQAVSGSGQKGVNELMTQLSALHENRPIEKKVYPQQIAQNLLPHIDVFLDNGYTKEEMKMVNETRKIMGDPGIMVSATCVRVPVVVGHSETVNLATEKKLTAREAREILARAPGVRVVDDPAKLVYPTPLMAAGQDLTLVGRIREDLSQTNGLDLFVVADNVRKGAASNAVQIAELLLRDYL